MQSSEKSDIVSFRRDLYHLGRPVTEALLFGVDEVMRRSLYTNQHSTIPDQRSTKTIPFAGLISYSANIQQINNL